MTIYTSYDVRIPMHEYNKVFADTTEKYRAAVEFFISVREKEAAILSEPKAQHVQLRKMEILTQRTIQSRNMILGRISINFPVI